MSAIQPIGSGSGGSLMQRTSAEIDIQVATATRYPRDIEKFKRKMKEQVTSSVETAASCFYELPRGGKKIRGKSVRLAEIAFANYRNIRVGAHVLGIEAGFVKIQGVAMDVESNAVASIEVMRRITDRNGKRYNDDMIATTTNAGIAIAKRNAIFEIIPKSYLLECEEAAKAMATGSGMDKRVVTDRWQRAVGRFSEIGVTEKQLLERAGKAAPGDITSDDIANLVSIFNAIEDGDTNVDDQFGVSEAEFTEEPKPEAKGKAHKKNETPNKMEKVKEKEPGDSLEEASRAMAKASGDDVVNEIIAAYAKTFGKPMNKWSQEERDQVAAEIERVNQ